MDFKAKFASEWQPLMGVNILPWAYNATKTWQFPILISSAHFNHLKIAWVGCLWVDILHRYNEC